MEAFCAKADFQRIFLGETVQKCGPVHRDEGTNDAISNTLGARHGMTRDVAECLF